MTFRHEFEDGLQRYARLNALWLTSVLLLTVAYVSVPASFVLGATLFFLGAINLGAAGIGCAYAIARDNA